MGRNQGFPRKNVDNSAAPRNQNMQIPRPNFCSQILISYPLFWLLRHIWVLYPPPFIFARSPKVLKNAWKHPLVPIFGRKDDSAYLENSRSYLYIQKIEFLVWSDQTYRVPMGQPPQPPVVPICSLGEPDHIH